MARTVGILIRDAAAGTNPHLAVANFTFRDGSDEYWRQTVFTTWIPFWFH